MMPSFIASVHYSQALNNVFSTGAQKLSYLVHMLEDLKLGARYDGFLYLVESTGNPPKLKSHHHIELELNLVVQGTC
jgi:hypothetical protein